MQMRKIIKIDEELCDGCGLCVSGCAEGAIQIIDGKARLVKEQYCDGFGDCIGTCPTGALTIENREAKVFDFDATKSYLDEVHGQEAVRRFEQAHLRHQLHEEHQRPPSFHGGGCPGSRMRELTPSVPSAVQPNESKQTTRVSELRQWPVQLHLVPPRAPFFNNKELVIMNPCGPLASANVHQDYLRNRAVVMGCPKLDDTRPYVEKLTQILSDPSIPKVIVVRMEVPCCGGQTVMAEEAVKASGRRDLVLQEDTLALDGTVKHSKTISTRTAGDNTGGNTDREITSDFPIDVSR